MENRNENNPVESSVCFFCKKDVAAKKTTCIGMDKKFTILQFIGSMDAQVCHLCYGRIFPKKHDLFAEEIAERQRLRLGEFAPEPSVRAITSLRSYIRGLDGEINRHMRAIRKIITSRDEALSQALALESKTLADVSGLYEQRRKEANAAISEASLRIAVFSRDGWACKKCSSTKSLSIDHIIPVAFGGGEDFENLQTLCRKCNTSKGSKLPSGFDKSKLPRARDKKTIDPYALPALPRKGEEDFAKFPYTVIDAGGFETGMKFERWQQAEDAAEARRKDGIMCGAINRKRHHRKKAKTLKQNERKGKSE